MIMTNKAMIKTVIDVSLTTKLGYNLRDHAVHVGYLAIAHCHIALLASDTLLAVKLLVVLVEKKFS